MKYIFIVVCLVVSTLANGQTKDTLTMKKIITTLYPDIDFRADTVGAIYVPNAPHIQLVPMFIVDGLTWWEILPEYHSDKFYHMGRNKGAALLPQHIRYEGDSIEGNTAFLDARERYWKNKLDTTKRPLKIKCPCPCHDGVVGFFHCWKDCCKWPNEPRFAPSPRPDSTHQRIKLITN